jgi:hypothetical protein
VARRRLRPVSPIAPWRTWAEIDGAARAARRIATVDTFECGLPDPPTSGAATPTASSSSRGSRPPSCATVRWSRSPQDRFRRRVGVAGGRLLPLGAHCGMLVKRCPEICPELTNSEPTRADLRRPERASAIRAALQTPFSQAEGRGFETRRPLLLDGRGCSCGAVAGPILDRVDEFGGPQAVFDVRDRFLVAAEPIEGVEVRKVGVAPVRAEVGVVDDRERSSPIGRLASSQISAGSDRVPVREHTPVTGR